LEPAAQTFALAQTYLGFSGKKHNAIRVLYAKFSRKEAACTPASFSSKRSRQEKTLQTQ
jgi:hypothetical protein